MLGQAAYLFILNAYFIFLSSTVILSLLKIPMVNDMDEKTWKKLRLRMIRNTIIIVIPSIVMLVVMANSQ